MLGPEVRGVLGEAFSQPPGAGTLGEDAVAPPLVGDLVRQKTMGHPPCVPALRGQHHQRRAAIAAGEERDLGHREPLVRKGAEPV